MSNKADELIAKAQRRDVVFGKAKPLVVTGK